MEEPLNPLFTINTFEGGYYYFFFNLLAISTAILIILYEGQRRKYPLSKWLLVIASGALSAIICSKLFSYSSEDWAFLLHAWQLPDSSEITVLGGIVGACIGASIARRWLGIQDSVSNTLVFAWPVALAIGRIGCVMGGCCYGTLTNSSLAINYGPNSLPYQAQLHSGLIHESAITSLGVHPTQLYEIAFSAIVLIIIGVCQRQKMLKAPGNLFFLSICFYGIFRYAEEFVRDGGATVLGLKYIQWGILAALVGLRLLIAYREKYWLSNSVKPAPSQSNTIKEPIWGLILLLIVWTGDSWYSHLEQTVIIGLIFLVILGTIIDLYVKRWGMPLLRPHYAYLLAPLLFACQTIKNQTTPYDDSTSHNTLSGGVMHGKYEETCGGTHTYGVGGVGISRTEKKGEFQKITYGIRGSTGQDWTSGRGSDSILVVNPYMHYDWKGIGLGVGGHLGKLIYDGGQTGYPFLGTYAFPQFDLRLGRYDKVFVEWKLADHYPGSWPSSAFKFAIGTGLGRMDGTSLRLGISDAGWFLEPYYILDNGLVLNPFFAYGSQTTYQFGMTIHYRFDFK